MSDNNSMLEVGDRVALEFDGLVRLGTVRLIALGSAASLGSRVSFDVEWDDAPGKESRGWLRHALRKIPKSPSGALLACVSGADQ